MVAIVGGLGFVLSMVVVWLAAEGVFRLARVGPPVVAAEWRPYLWLVGGILVALLGVGACVRVVQHLRADDPPV